MPWSSRDFISACEELHNSGFRVDLKPGMQCARGFADLGFEEFLVLPGEKLLSLLTGERSALLETHLEHLFPVLSPDHMLTCIHRIGFDVVSLKSKDQRTWSLKMKSSGKGGSFTFEAGALDLVLVHALRLAHREQNPSCNLVNA